MQTQSKDLILFWNRDAQQIAYRNVLMYYPVLAWVYKWFTLQI